MTIAVWSVKGGVGVTSVAALLAIAQAERAEPAVLLDLCGDLPALLGSPDLDEVDAAPGIADWCATPEPTAAALARIERPVRTDVSLIPRGTAAFPDDATPLLQVLDTSQRQPIIDCGVVAEHDSFRRHIVNAAQIRLLVVRECFVNLRAVQKSTWEPTAVVVLKEPGRHLGRVDVEAVAGAPVVAEIAVDAAIARSLDAGLATARVPRRLLRTLSHVPDVARQFNESRVTTASHHAR